MPIITYSPAYTIVPTYECFNRCSYCNFRVDPGADKWMTLDRATQILADLQDKDVCEILILSGEVHPRSSRRQAWIERIYDLGNLALEMGFLPHTNAGPLSFREMEKLAQVNVSMGLMLEALDPALLAGVHRHAPSKLPQIRLEQLDWAGKLQIPFTTGLLLGIGESAIDWESSLQAIADIHDRWGHIQEVILQPYSPGSQESFSGMGFDIQKLPVVISLARQILPTNVAIQIPPNLIPNPDLLLTCLNAGARDLGGIVPKDEVNPDYHHLQLSELTSLLANAGWELRPRLPVYPDRVHDLSDRLQAYVRTSKACLV
ncbi:7,8-didemethyl-8-hydroxy-5-deazariboflavin synthase subunit CofG [Chamaesiphon minutus]|uniref:7,8-didemethyl-8-hydroxy-5-deazariboflavin synthase n=1 Tax=Chamaesiphon minutus (strain ATCC 27169 / PCC 6605) TaxID=1173020 RepID=K9UH91_CHAP6|nr:7,8-didemethyl-8-hydroxy-5-deazariboflavin synthase subunit CofG [Chamaesiphon minutus]AFY94180.1 7,8-didemethyl-8-hydroxy-5-deazariboflavin synthase, CofG subunit [Chamaesiphon minutus PCC 6605]